MSKHLGDFDTSTVVYGKFTTFRPSTGAAFTLGGTPALSVYKDNSVTQSTTGVTLTADFDSVTGFNHFAIDTSADGTFYAAGSFFDVVITTGTVDSVSVVGSVVGSFTIRKDSALKPATAGRTLVVDASGLGDANAVKLGPSGSGTAQTARDIGASVLLSSGSGTGQVLLSSGKVSEVVLVDTLTTYTGNTPQTGDSFALIGTAGVGLTNLGDARIAHLNADITSRMATFTLPTNFSSFAIDSGGRIVLQPQQVLLKKNASITITFPMTDATTHAPKTGLSVTAQRSIDGAAIAGCANSVSELSGGVYSLLLAGSDLNGAMITLIFSAAGADTRFMGVVTQP